MMYRIFFHTYVTKNYTDIPAYNKEQAVRRFNNTIGRQHNGKVFIDNVIVINELLNK